MADKKPKNEEKKKAECPLSRVEHAKSKNIVIAIDGKEFVAQPREFSTGSFGYGLSDKVTILHGDVPVRYQVSVNITAIGSKDAK